MPIKLSICIATYNRGAYIGATLDVILAQLRPGVEIVVVDGASPDDTSDVMAAYQERCSEIRYFREAKNSGVDADFDKAVSYASGEYCWLMTDDDLLKSDAISRVLSELDGNKELIVLNSEVRNIELTNVFEDRRLKLIEDREYCKETKELMFSDTAAYLSFIGCVVIKRSCWLERDRASYYGTLFIHVGVIFQAPSLTEVKVIADPLVIVRYGNAMWSSRAFEIWMFKWPRLIWSFSEFSPERKRLVCRREPWRSVKALIHNRALGAYNIAEFRNLPKLGKYSLSFVFSFLVSIFPAALANVIMVLYFSTLGRPAPMAIHDLLFSRNASKTSRFIARVLGYEER
ncbi:MAG: glycosyl transferase [Thalassospira sp.]|uniref:glycosyltransferase family 2 protein n=1 Tax=Thalassospira sp. TaxID=1912094 RepID=UPI000C67C88B|nr:glycosyltransferase family 2 protein [Thalassospira sp.]MAZ35629.1 glycosyl transferase [Thalassospira sp.]|tara:strand:+ start:453 stop:1487 length:1035 start_codon:yes stop_codon:yes gene_type:complete